MKKLIIFLTFLAIKLNGQNIYPCVPDNLIMNWLNKQNSFQFRREVGINVDYFGYENQGGVDNPEYSYHTKCLSSSAKAKIISLLKGEPYNFEKELDEEREKYYGLNSDWADDEIKYRLKGDTTRLEEKLDSLYQPMRAKKLAGKKEEEYSIELVRFVGNIYFYDAIPILKAELKSPHKYADNLDLIKETLARFGDVYWINHYLNVLAKSSEDWQEWSSKASVAFYINNVDCFKKFYRFALNNKNS